MQNSPSGLPMLLDWYQALKPNLESPNIKSYAPNRGQCSPLSYTWSSYSSQKGVLVYDQKPKILEMMQRPSLNHSIAMLNLKHNIMPGPPPQKGPLFWFPTGILLQTRTSDSSLGLNAMRSNNVVFNNIPVNLMYRYASPADDGRSRWAVIRWVPLDETYTV